MYICTFTLNKQGIYTVVVVTYNEQSYARHILYTPSQCRTELIDLRMRVSNHQVDFHRPNHSKGHQSCNVYKNVVVLVLPPRNYQVGNEHVQYSRGGATVLVLAGQQSCDRSMDRRTDKVATYNDNKNIIEERRE